MITTPTVLMLGAGASAPYGFPTGRQLLMQICDEGRTNFAQASTKEKLATYGFSAEEVQIFQQELRHSMQPSVDAFLENRPKYLPIGKAAIAACLIPYESQSHLHRKAEQLEWYEYLFQHMADLHGEFPDNKLSVITFNYDRSLEYFLLLALKHSYGLGEREAVSLLDTIPLIHVYGQLGKPDFLSPEGRGYAPGVDTDIIDKAVAEIKILTEASEPTAEFARAHELIANADVLCFLGFGYHPTNWERLRVNKLFGGNLVFGTVYGLGSAEIGQVRLQFSGNIRRRLYLGSDTDDSLAFLRSKRILY